MWSYLIDLESGNSSTYTIYWRSVKLVNSEGVKRDVVVVPVYPDSKQKCVYSLFMLLIGTISGIIGILSRSSRSLNPLNNYLILRHMVRNKVLLK